VRHAGCPQPTRFARTIACLSLAAGYVAGHAQAQSGDAADSATSPASAREQFRQWRATQDRRIAEIDAEIAANGPYSNRLYEMYFSLAELYREHGDHAEAVAMLEDALHVTRVNYGLFSMEQVAVTRALIESAIAAGQPDRVADLDAQLLRIAWDNLDDVRSARILEETADRQMQVYERYVAGELPPQISINIDSGPQSPNFDSNRFIGMSNLSQARRNYRQSIAVLQRAGEATGERILTLETKLIEGYFLEAEAERERATRSESIMTLRMRGGGRLQSLFQRGEATYRRMIARAIKTDDVELAASAMIGLADWNLLFSRNGTALRLYSDAYAALRRLGASEQYLTQVFAPDVPVVLPAFNANPLVRAPADDPGPFVDVTMVMSRYGRSRARSLDTSADAGLEAAEAALRRIVTTSRFRPHIVDGEPQNRTEIEFRYYVDTDEARESRRLSNDSG
jgi:tetratricopeptide (TPR) repeat protein